MRISKLLKSPLETGLSFGLTSGVITTLGLMVGIQSSTNSKIAVIGAILTIAVADALSDALGMHISEESTRMPEAGVWMATVSTLFSKFTFSAIFIFPVLIFGLQQAVIISVILGLLLLGALSYFLALQEKQSPLKVIGGHLSIAVVVIILSQIIGTLISSTLRS